MLRGISGKAVRRTLTVLACPVQYADRGAIYLNGLDTDLNKKVIISGGKDYQNTVNDIFYYCFSSYFCYCLFLCIRILLFTDLSFGSSFLSVIF